MDSLQWEDQCQLDSICLFSQVVLPCLFPYHSYRESLKCFKPSFQSLCRLTARWRMEGSYPILVRNLSMPPALPTVHLPLAAPQVIQLASVAAHQIISGSNSACCTAPVLITMTGLSFPEPVLPHPPCCITCFFFSKVSANDLLWDK